MAAYLDDAVIHSARLSDHLYHLREVLGELWKAKPTANPVSAI